MANTSKTTNTPAKSMAELMARSGNNFQALQKGQIVEGTIKTLSPREILMDIGAKGDALVIEYDKQNLENLLSFLKVGDRVKASVISPESEEGFPVLSLRRTLDDIIFKKFENLSKNEESFEVEVTEATRGGFFAITGEGIKGFIPSSQITDEESPVGKKIQVKLLELDRTKKKVVFSQKALSFVMNPAEIGKYVKRGDSVKAEVASVTPYGLYVVISKEKGVKIEGFVHISEISYERVEDLASKYKAGDTIEAQVLEIDSANHRANLSVKKTQADTFTTVREKYKVEDKVKGSVKDVKSRGVIIDLGDGINGMITTDKIPSGTTYEKGQSVEAEVTGFDDRRRVVLLSPVLKAVPVTYR